MPPSTVGTVMLSPGQRKLRPVHMEGRHMPQGVKMAIRIP